ncbi:helicase-related protein [Terasakiella sp. A23]|uniref:helicase-related protein n=1 Tax=Terasakiella sp. FCG-A23 TaxID=3080561 RepID=UPI002952D3D2|nr:helicase-related protein [Terasakiella sp. A23]MDV7339960.1 helicase-related protein [Terasakiella sp. A23]
MQIDTSQRARISAVLGPTNTGKTYLALERMMAHATGMIGFPLRLLARENYDRVCEIKGPEQVALITGEEKIVPPHARYFLCTVESMPLERDVEFIAIDEIQLCSDPDRGHIFTDRLLNARGRSETMFMGSRTIAPLIRQLVDEVEFEERPRFSNLTYTGSKKITRLPNRSAIVAFSASEVYAIAELIRRQKGGAAVVLGALSPRTRNSQVELYQAGEVDYIVATDAIGMGLNMDVDHVAFAALSKFDGRQMRGLTLPETAQIAGRAGRYMRDGTFGVTGDCPEMDPEIIERLEAHEFDVVEQIYWRNSRIRFTSVETLQMDLRAAPKSKNLIRPRIPEDEITLDFLVKNPDVLAYASHPKRVKLLWDVCQIPDFAKTMSDSHPRLLGQIYMHLCTHKNILPTDWVAGHVQRLDRTDGDIDTLTQRLSNIRTWTYISQRGQWLHDPAHWQGITREIEDKLSDALHEQLTKRFVDRRTSTLMKKLKDREDLLAAVTKLGDVLVEGHFVGRLEGFHFAADETDNPHAKRAVNSAALKALRQEMDRRVALFEEEKQDAFSLRDDGFILWRGHACARLFKGSDILHPRLETLTFDLIDEPLRIRVKAKLRDWLDQTIQGTLAPLFKLEKANVGGAARGIAFQVRENLGSLARKEVAGLIEDLPLKDRKALRKAGLIFGRHSLYCPKLLKAAAVRLRADLWTLYYQPEIIPAYPGEGMMSFAYEKGMPHGFYEAIGYRRFDNLCLRHDMIERVAELAWERTKKSKVVIDGDFVSLAGCSHAAMAEILKRLGYFVEKQGDDLKVGRKKSHMKKKAVSKKKKPRVRVSPDSPFAELKNWNK